MMHRRSTTIATEEDVWAAVLASWDWLACPTLTFGFIFHVRDAFKDMREVLDDH